MSGKIGYVYDEQMAKHHHPKNSSHPEGPHRIQVAVQVLQECGLLEKMTKIPSRYVGAVYANHWFSLFLLPNGSDIKKAKKRD